MALTHESIRGAVQRKAQRARQKVLSAEDELVAANEALKDAIPRKDVDAIAEAAVRTAKAEDEVHEAAQELEVVDELLEESRVSPRGGSGASGEGLKSLLPFLGKRPR